MKGQRLYEIICRHSQGEGWSPWARLSTEAQARYEAMAADFSETGRSMWNRATISMANDIGVDVLTSPEVSQVLQYLSIQFERIS